MVKTGWKVRDRITGYTGIVVARTEWLNKCVRCTVQSNNQKDGVPVDPQTFDQEQLEVLDKSDPLADVPKKKATGGPQGKDPTRTANPSR